MKNPHHHVLSKKQKRQLEKDRVDANERMRQYMEKTKERFLNALEVGKDFDARGVLAGPTKKKRLMGA